AEEFKKKARGKARLNVPFCDLTDDEKQFVYQHIRRYFAEIETKKYKVHVRVFLSRYRGYAQCPDCKGSRLRAAALNVRVGNCTIAEVVRLNIREAYEYFETLDLAPEERAI